MVVGLIVEEISNVDAKYVSHWSAKYRSRSQTNRQTNGKVGTYVAKSGGQGDVSCKV